MSGKPTVYVQGLLQIDRWKHCSWISARTNKASVYMAATKWWQEARSSVNPTSKRQVLHLHSGYEAQQGCISCFLHTWSWRFSVGEKVWIKPAIQSDFKLVQNTKAEKGYWSDKLQAKIKVSSGCFVLKTNMVRNSHCQDSSLQGRKGFSLDIHPAFYQKSLLERQVARERHAQAVCLKQGINIVRRVFGKLVLSFC